MNKLVVSAGPHIHAPDSVNRIMWLVSASLIPAGAAGAVIFGPAALWIILVSAAAAVLTEAAIQALGRKQVTVADGSAFLTGLLVAYNLPSGVPLWLAVTGSAFAVAIGKHVFGGLGQNIFNPALVGRAFLMASWPRFMTTFPLPHGVDSVTQATPLAAVKHGGTLPVSYTDLFLGSIGGCIGEVSKIALLAGAIFLLVKRYISWHIPAAFIGTTCLLTFVFGPSGFFTGDALFHALSGGLILGAFFMATDYVTSPLTTKGRIIFGIGCGALTAVIRIWGGYPEGVSYAILMMNAAAPLIDRYTKTAGYGGKNRRT